MMPLGVHHLAFRTDDVERLAAFYTSVLGLAVRRRGDGRIWLAAGETILMLERREPSEPAVPAGSMELVAFAKAPAELPPFERHLAAVGVAIEARTAFTLYFRDPDGRRMAVSCYEHGA
jgi:catechol 2,3-dioxygenase-like lactoylglutathione lyase family enzyme